MTTVVLGGEKGGGGKSSLALTVAVHQAMKGRAVLMVDCDPQRNALDWCSIRRKAATQPSIASAALYGDGVAMEIKELARPYDDVVIDTRGADSVELRSAMTIADILVTPTRTGFFDIKTMLKMDSLVALAQALNPKMKALVLLNQASATPGSVDVTGALEQLAKFPHYMVMSAIIHSRVSFTRCLFEGLSVVEFLPRDEKAAAEATAFSEEVWAS